jgi:hypothetical protein
MPVTSPDQRAAELLIASLERTRGELKEIIGDVLDNYIDKRDASGGQKLAARLHRMVGSICDDLDDVRGTH